MVENFEKFDKIFNLPIVGPFLKDLLIGEEAQKPGGWYAKARLEFIKEK
ncbi:MAG: hypothetical protein H6765_04400 [Candidatus Peribacteria bacterium]|nr:MAG: hypothetical protein H6765_04400 [Candidatus Peribacteria bacterium]